MITSSKDNVHHDIVVIDRNGAHTLEGEAYTYLIYVRTGGKEAVVVALATPQTMAGSIKGHTWNKGQVNTVVIVKDFSDGFHDMKGSFLKVSTRGVATEFHRLIASDLGQQHRMTFCHQLVN